jgi:DNA-binding beta-propeller fold protein YncE
MSRLTSLALLFLVVPSPAQDSRPTGPLLVVLNKSSGTAAFLDPHAGRVLREVKVGIGPHEAATAPDGFVVVCNYGDQRPGQTLSLLDPFGSQDPRTINLAPYRRPHGIQFLPGGRAVVTAETERKLLVVDLEAGKVEHAIDTKQVASHMVALDASEGGARRRAR